MLKLRVTPKYTQLHLFKKLFVYSYQHRYITVYNKIKIVRSLYCNFKF